MIAAYFQAIQRPLSFLGSTYRDLTQAKTDFETMWNLMESKTEMSEGPNVVPQLTDGAQIEFRDVSFGYNNDKLSKFWQVFFFTPTGIFSFKWFESFYRTRRKGCHRWWIWKWKVNCCKTIISIL